jgi:hypothetical protein
MKDRSIEIATITQGMLPLGLEQQLRDVEQHGPRLARMRAALRARRDEAQSHEQSESTPDDPLRAQQEQTFVELFSRTQAVLKETGFSDRSVFPYISNTCWEVSPSIEIDQGSDRTTAMTVIARMERRDIRHAWYGRAVYVDIATFATYKDNKCPLDIYRLALEPYGDPRDRPCKAPLATIVPKIDSLLTIVEETLDLEQ